MIMNLHHKTIGVCVSSVFAAITIGGLIHSDIVKTANYEKEVTPLIQPFLSKHDENENGAIDYEEGIKLSRELGYGGIFPSKDVSFTIRSGYSNDRTMDLHIFSNSGFKVDVDNDGDTHPESKYIKPVWEHHHYFPVGSLEQ